MSGRGVPLGDITQGGERRELERKGDNGREICVEKEEACKMVLTGIRTYFPEFIEEAREDAVELVRQAYVWADQQFGLEEAREWAQGYRVPEAVVKADLDALERAGGNLVEMARRARRDRWSNRLSLDRVEAMIAQENPERDKLTELATIGIRVLLPEKFTPSGIRGRPPIRKKLLQAGGAVEKMIVENFRDKGLAAVLPVSVIEEMGEQGAGVHMHTLSHAPKHDSRKGRNVGDLGACGEGTPLNSEETKKMADDKWGNIVNVDLQGLITMIQNFWEDTRAKDDTAVWEDVVLWKMDLSGAFTLLDMAPEDVPLVAAEMQGGFVALFYCGMFGWSPMPAVFQVLTRAIKWELQQVGRLKGRMDMYVDDMVGVSLRRHMDEDMGAARHLCTKLLGEGSVEEKKTEWGRRMTFIGWDIDLDKKLVTLAKKNALKALYGFSTEGARERVPMTAIQRWASWAERYGEICWYMKPFRRILYGAVRKEFEHKSVKLPRRVRMVVRLYQALMALTVVKEQSFTRSLDSFVRKPPTLTIQFDGSLTGVGVTWFTRHGRRETVLGGIAVSLRMLDFGDDSSNQNCAEFIGVMIGLIGAIENSWDTSAIWLRGDSTTALAWAEGGRFRSERVMNAAMVMAMVCVKREVNIVGTELITSEENWLCDGQSRWNGRERWRELMRRVGGRNRAFSEMRRVEVSRVEEVLDLCDPRTEWESDQEFGEHWGRVNKFAGVVCSSPHM